ncbi:MAG: thioredoxin domain-containing protein [Candidatus Paceibacterota bacterium]
METPQETEVKKKNTISIANSIVVAGVLVALAIVFSSSGKTVVDSSNKTNDNLAIEEVTEEDFIKGDKNAEITVVEYSDFSCSFCARYHPTMKRLVEEFDGKVRWVYRHLPIFNKPAAVASSCVGNILGDESFFLYADKLFENQKDINQDFLKKEALVLGVNESDYDTCINDQALNDKISRDFTKIRVLAGFNATPHTVIIDSDGNMYPFSGALPYEEVSALVESFLK